MQCYYLYESPFGFAYLFTLQNISNIKTQCVRLRVSFNSWSIICDEIRGDCVESEQLVMVVSSSFVFPQCISCSTSVLARFKPGLGFCCRLYLFCFAGSFCVSSVPDFRNHRVLQILPVRPVSVLEVPGSAPGLLERCLGQSVFVLRPFLVVLQVPHAVEPL